MDFADYKKKFNHEDAVGWQSIDKKLNEVFSEIAPRHYPPLCGVLFIAGGTGLLQKVSKKMEILRWRNETQRLKKKARPEGKRLNIIDSM